MRNYIVASWNDADQYDYSGEQIGNRLSKSQRVHFNPDGSACVASYADPEPKSKISIADRILPQKRRLNKLNEEILELEAAYRAGEVSLADYSVLRDVAFAKRARAEVLYRKAISVKAPSYDEEDTAQTWEETYKVSGVYASESCDQREEGVPDWIMDLSESNSLKNILKKACIITRKVIHYKHKISSYLQTLKEV